MDFLEKDLEDILYNSSQNDVFPLGLHHFYFDSIFRQVRITGYGVIDLMTLRYDNDSKEITITIYELKNKKVSAETFWQLLRYIKAVNQVINDFNLKNHPIRVLGVMIGREIDDSNDFCFLPTLDTNQISIYTYNYSLKGIRFKLQGDSYYKTAYKGDFNFSQLNPLSKISFMKCLLSGVDNNTF